MFEQVLTQRTLSAAGSRLLSNGQVPTQQVLYMRGGYQI